MIYSILVYFFLITCSLQSMESENNFLSLKMLATFLGYHQAKKCGESIELPQSKVRHVHAQTRKKIFEQKTFEFVNDIQEKLPQEIGAVITQLCFGDLCKSLYVQSYTQYKSYNSECELGIYALALNPNYNNCIVGCLDDCTIVMSDSGKIEKYLDIPAGEPDFISDFAIDAQNQLLLVGRLSGTFNSYNITNGKKVNTCDLEKNAIKSMVIDAERQRVLYTTFERTGGCWRYMGNENSNLPQITKMKGEGHIYGLACNSDANIGYVETKNRILPFDLSTDKLFTAIPKPNRLIGSSNRFKSDPITGMLIVAGPKTLTFFDLETQKQYVVPGCGQNHSDIDVFDYDPRTGMIGAEFAEKSGIVTIIKPKLNYTAMCAMSLADYVQIKDVLDRDTKKVVY